MKNVISLLEINLDTLTNNEPINRKEGHHAQADLEAETADQIRYAIGILKAVDKGLV